MSTQGFADPLLGLVLADRYEVLRRLGGGGMGTVYEARHRTLGKRVAIKVLHEQHAAKSETIQRFVNEARAAAALGHRNIIDASDIGATPSGALFIVLEYLEGEDLEHVIAREGALPVSRAVKILRQVASALAAAHAQGIVHRDLKPENVYLVSRGEERDFVKVLDFGISKFTTGDTSNMTRKGTVLGTPSYMAPEQLLDSSRADARADIYSAGVMAYQLLSARLPFEGETFYELAHRALTETPVPLGELRGGLARELVAAIERAMAKNRDERFATMEDFSRALQPFESVGDEGVTGVGLRAATGRVEGRGSAVTGVESTMAAPSASSTASVEHTGVMGARRTQRFCPACARSIGADPACEFCGTEVDDLRIGTILEGRYRIDRPLAAGGMGRVYVGTHLSLQQSVAIKFLHGQWTESAEARARFRREAMTLARLRHPGIVTVFDYGEYEGDLYMVMELVKGRVLRDLAPEGTALPAPRALALVELVLQVLEFAHAQGVVHRDFKPDNVMLLELGESIERIKLLDFGLAVQTRVATDERLTSAGAIQGTPLYMSPEQCRGRDVGPETDVYAVGAVLFELLSGEPPFRGASVADTLAQHMFAPIPRIGDRGARPVLSPSLEALVSASLAKDPAHRPTAASMRAELQRIASGRDESTRLAQAVAEKVSAADVERVDRAVYRSPGTTSAPQPAARDGAAATGVAVLLWGLSPARRGPLETALRVLGHPIYACDAQAAPGETFASQPSRVVLLAWGAGAAEQLAALRARPGFARTPVLAVDAADTADTMAIIRAGATDVTYANATHDAIVARVARLAKRAR